MSRCIIAGSRGIINYELLCAIIEAHKSKFDITEVVSGRCRNSPDMLGERWAKEHDVPIKSFPADWKDLSQPDVRIRYNRRGEPYDANAGFRRNRWMAEYAAEDPSGCAIVLWNGISNGARDMKELAQEHGLDCLFVRVAGSEVVVQELLKGNRYGNE